MDLNQLYFEHQTLVIKAERAPTRRLRQVLEVAASHIAGRIGCMQRSLGASAAKGWDTLAVTGESSLASSTRHLQGYLS